jgi:DUF1680 family protein
MSRRNPILSDGIRANRSLNWLDAGALAFAIACSLALLAQAASGTSPQAELFSITDVRLLDGPFKRSQDVNGRYIVQHDMDRLLAPFRIEAGLEPKRAMYGGWESAGMGGHAAGHHLSALAQMYAATGDQQFRQRLDYMVTELAACQKAHGDGYVGGVPEGRLLWQEIAARKIYAGPFHLNDKWVPWYNLHKTFAGLRDAWLIAGNGQAREVCIGLADWCDRLTANLSEDNMQSMLVTEHGGMNEVLADMSEIADDRKYLALSKRFSHRLMLDPLLAKQDRLTGMHANTNIPKVVGFARIGKLTDDPAWIDAAKFFWENVTTRRTVAIGGHGVSSFFNPPNNFSELIESRDGLETCGTHNMLRLTEQLFRLDPQAGYADFYERALFNHILSSQHPESGGLVYFTPMRPGSRRGYMRAESVLPCCVGTGIQSHGKHGRFIYAFGDGVLYVNLFIASELNWKERGLKLRQETAFPDVPRTRLVMSLESPAQLELRVRFPGWVGENKFKILVNGKLWPVEASPSSYATVDREWQDGDQVDIELPMHTRLERLPDESDYAAVLHGPIVLAGKLDIDDLIARVTGDTSSFGLRPDAPLDDAPRLSGSDEDVVAGIEPVPDRALTFTARKVILPSRFREVELIPFSRLHDSRYMVYWKIVKRAEQHSH